MVSPLFAPSFSVIFSFTCVTFSFSGGISVDLSCFWGQKVEQFVLKSGRGDGNFDLFAL